MSGTRQHFIPRFLQAGFASHRSGEKVFTWVHRKGVAPFNTNIINIGVEGKFYTTEGNTTADDLITSAEGSLGSLLEGLKSGDPEFLRDPRLPILIAHLEIRTRHLRESFLRTGELLASKLLEFLSDENTFASYMTKKLERDPTILRKAFAEEFVKRGLPINQLDSFLQLATPLVPTLIQAQRAEFPRLAAQLRDALPTIMKNATKSGHVKVLQSTIALELRVQRYEQLSFNIAEVNDMRMILGDSAVLYSVAGSRRYKAFLDADTILNAVFLPLDGERVLIGSRDGMVKDVPLDLPNAIAKCSLEYFISAESTYQHEALRDQIGADAHMLELLEIEEIVTEALQ